MNSEKHYINKECVNRKYKKCKSKKVLHIFFINRKQTQLESKKNLNDESKNIKLYFYQKKSIRNRAMYLLYSKNERMNQREIK